MYEKNFLAKRMEHLLSFFFLLHFYHEEVRSGIFFERKQDCFVRNQVSLKGQFHYDHLVMKTAQSINC